MPGILIKNVTVITMQGRDHIISDGEIAIDGGIIIGVGQVGTVTPDFKPNRVIDGQGYVAVPGLINCHTHAAMTLLRAQTTQAQMFSSSSSTSMYAPSYQNTQNTTKTEVKKERITITPEGNRIVETITETRYNTSTPSSSSSSSSSTNTPNYAERLGLSQYQPIERTFNPISQSNGTVHAKPVRMDGGFPVFFD